MVAIQITGQGSQLGLQFGTLSFQFANDGMDALHGGLGGNKALLILEIQQGLAGLQHLGVRHRYLFFQELHLRPGQGVAHLIHEALTLVDQHVGNGLGRPGIIGLGADAQDSRIVIVFYGNAREVVPMEPFDGGVLEPEA